MTTKELYIKHKTGDISNQKFLYEVRRDSNLPWITNMTSYEDAVKILKNKGIINEADGKKYGDVEVISKTIDMVNPYEYSKGMNYELDMADNAVRTDLTEEEVLAAQKIVLKNITKDANYYTKLYAGLKPTADTGNYIEIEIAGKSLEKNLKAEMQGRKADGYIKKELKKDAKSNVKDDLGKKEAGTKKPKGVSEFKAKGVTGSFKTIKEGIEEILREKLAQKKSKVKEHHNDPDFPVIKGLYELLDAIVADWGKEDLYQVVEDIIVAYTEPDDTMISKKAINVIKDVLENYDVLEDYADLVNKIAVKEPGQAPTAMDRMYNSDAWVQAQRDMNEAPKKSSAEKMKEALKKALKSDDKVKAIKEKKDKSLEEGALDDQIAQAEKAVAQKKKETADAEKKLADIKAKEAAAEAQG